MVNAALFSLIDAHQNAVSAMTRALFHEPDSQILAWDYGLALCKSESSGNYIVGALWLASEFAIGASRPAVVNGDGLAPTWQSRHAAIKCAA